MVPGVVGSSPISHPRQTGDRGCPGPLFSFHIGASPSGKARDFDSLIRWFESSRPSHFSCRPGGESMFDPVAQSAEQLPFKQWVRGSNPRRVTIKSKRYRCHWRKASGINRFRAFFARKFTNDSIDANHCFPLTGGIRTPFFRRLANSEPCGALFEAVIFKKGAIFLSKE